MHVMQKLVATFVKLKEFKPMHIPKIFEINDLAIIEQFIKEIGLATLISKGSKWPMGTHIPLQLVLNDKGEKVLWGHISKANDQWQDFEKDSNVLAIFLSPVNSYISSSWYAQPNAPTWNYLSVHITGKLTIIEGEKLWESVRQLTNNYEQKMENSVSLDTLPESVKKQMNGIVGFEIAITKIEAAFKISQNRTVEDYENIIKMLRLTEDLNAKLMADIMERKQKKPN
jgi:transcriptional regulator